MRQFSLRAAVALGCGVAVGFAAAPAAPAATLQVAQLVVD